MLSEQDLTSLHREAEKDTVGNYALLRAIDTAIDLRNVLENLRYWEANRTVPCPGPAFQTMDDKTFREFVRDKLAEVGIK